MNTANNRTKGLGRLARNFMFFI